MIWDQTHQLQKCLNETDIRMKYNNEDGHYTKVTTMNPWNTNTDEEQEEERTLDMTLKLNSWTLLKDVI